MSAVFSPTATKRWLTCPVLHSLYTDGWRLRVVGKRDLAGILGSAMAAGTAVYHRACAVFSPTAVVSAMYDAAIREGVAEVKARLQELKDVGQVIRPEDEPLALSLESKVSKALLRYMEAAPIPASWTIEHVEHTIVDGGNCRIDLGIQTPMGPAIADVKCKLTLDARYRQKTIEGYRVDRQLKHYCHFYEQMIGEPVRDYYVILVVIEPKFSVEVLPYTLAPEVLRAWGQSSWQVWQDMAGEHAHRHVYQRDESCLSTFGRCDMYRACHEFFYDEHLMLNSGEYINVKGHHAEAV